jgi:hypothetical protein
LRETSCEDETGKGSAELTWATNLRRSFGGDGALTELVLDDGVTSWRESWSPDGTYQFFSFSSQYEQCILPDGSATFAGVNRIKIFPDGSEHWKRRDGRTVEKSSFLARGILRLSQFAERIFETPSLTVVDFEAGERICFSQDGLVVSLNDGTFILAPRGSLEGTILTAEGDIFPDSWNETLHRFVFGHRRLFESIPRLSEYVSKMFGFGKASFEEAMNKSLTAEQQLRLKAVWDDMKSTPIIEPFRDTIAGARQTFDFSPES